MTLEERLEKRNAEMAEVRARIQGYLSELDHLNQRALLLQGAIEELKEIQAEETTSETT